MTTSRVASFLTPAKRGSRDTLKNVEYHSKQRSEIAAEDFQILHQVYTATHLVGVRLPPKNDASELSIRNED
jgi:hypothetical protein